MNIKNYENIEHSRLKELIDKATWLSFSPSDSLDPDNRFLKSMMSPANALAGVTDYQDHRRDKLADLKPKVYEEIKTRLCQNGNYYNIHGIPFDTIIVKKFNGSWEAECSWDDGSKCFFEQDRLNAKERMKKLKENI